MFVAGNWKMNMDLAAARQLASGVVSAVGDPGDVDVAICPPFVNLDATFSVLHGSRIRLGAQNMHQEKSGAYTGEISAAMLRAVGCQYVIVGHSERRKYFGETDETVREKVDQAGRFRLVPIMCVGETLDARDGGEAQDVVERQVRQGLEDVEIASSANLVVAYEPVWAIGTGRTASPEQAQEMHAHIRSILLDLYGDDMAVGIEIVYGGSVKPGNAAELFAGSDVDGGLIGGASLAAEDFAAIVRAARESG